MLSKTPNPAQAVADASDPIFAAIERVRQANAVVKSLIHVEETESVEAQSAAVDEFSRTVPTTLPGLFAMILYVAELVDDTGDYDTPAPFAHDAPIFQTLATAARAISKGGSAGAPSR